MPEVLIFEMGAPGRRGSSLAALDVPARPLTELVPAWALRKGDLDLPEVSEQEAVRHFTRLSRQNYGVDVGFYPLGSCTMKYNPKVNEDLASLEGFIDLHPYEPEELVQGALELMHRLERFLAEIAGMDRVTLQPAAGAHGELTGLLMIRAYHAARGEGEKRRVVIVPDSAHGTNPASAAMAGYEVVEVPSNARGTVDVELLARAADDRIAALMLTNPNTLGLFEENIQEISRVIHDAGGLLYYDGANMNAILGIARPGDMGFDVVHFNLHKTFGTPHGGGGPGSGPVGVRGPLVDFLPVPTVEFEGGRYRLDYDRPKSIGRVRSFYGNFGVLVKAYAYIRALGREGLRQASEDAVLAANYLMASLREHYHLPYDQRCMHEFVISAREQAKRGVRALDIAKSLIDRGIHPPTVYFPLIVKEAIMIEPTETEPIEVLDAFIDAMIEIDRRSQEDPELLKVSPKSTPVGRLDEVTAARRPRLTWKRDHPAPS